MATQLDKIFIYNTGSGKILYEAKVSAYSFTVGMDATEGNIQITSTLRELKYGQIKPWVHSVAIVARNNRVKAAGPIYRREMNPGAGTATITAGSFMSIAKKRVVMGATNPVLSYKAGGTYGARKTDGSVTTYQWTVNSTKAGLVLSLAKTHMGDLPGINTITIPTGTNTRTYDGLELQTVADRMNDIFNTDDPPHIAWDATVTTSGSDRIIKWTPRTITNTATVWRFDLNAPQSPVVEWKLTEDAASEANRCWEVSQLAQGKNTGTDTGQRSMFARYDSKRYETQGGIVLVSVDGSHDNVTNGVTLANYAKAGANARPALSIDLTMQRGQPNEWASGSFDADLMRVGEKMALTVSQVDFGLYTFTGYISEMSGDAAGTLTIKLDRVIQTAGLIKDGGDVDENQAPSRDLVDRVKELEDWVRREKNPIKGGGIDAGSIPTTIADDAITHGEGFNQTVLTAAANDLPAGSVNGSKLTDGTVSTAKYADSSVTSAKIKDGTIATADMADGAVATAKLADKSVATAKLGDSSVTTPKLGDGAVTTPKLGDGAVTTPKLGDGAVTTPKIGAEAVTGEKQARRTYGTTQLWANTATFDGWTIPNIFSVHTGDGTRDRVTCYYLTADAAASQSAVGIYTHAARLPYADLAGQSFTVSVEVRLDAATPALPTNGIHARVYVYAAETGGTSVRNVQKNFQISELVVGKWVRLEATFSADETVGTTGAAWLVPAIYFTGARPAFAVRAPQCERGTRATDWHLKAGELPPATIGSEAIATGAITTPKIDDEAVGHFQLADGAVFGEKIPDGGVEASHLNEGITAGGHNYAYGAKKFTGWSGVTDSYHQLELVGEGFGDYNACVWLAQSSSAYRPILSPQRPLASTLIPALENTDGKIWVSAHVSIAANATGTFHLALDLFHEGATSRYKTLTKSFNLATYAGFTGNLAASFTKADITGDAAYAATDTWAMRISSNSTQARAVIAARPQTEVGALHTDWRPSPDEDVDGANILDGSIIPGKFEAGAIQGLDIGDHEISGNKLTADASGYWWGYDLMGVASMHETPWWWTLTGPVSIATDFGVWPRAGLNMEDKGTSSAVGGWVYVKPGDQWLWSFNARTAAGSTSGGELQFKIVYFTGAGSGTYNETILWSSASVPTSYPASSHTGEWTVPSGAWKARAEWWYYGAGQDGVLVAVRPEGMRLATRFAEILGTVVSSQIANGAVITAKFADKSVTSAKLGDGAVVQGKLGTGAVTQNTIADGAVGHFQLADESVGYGKLMPEGVTLEALNNDILTAWDDLLPDPGRIPGNTWYELTNATISNTYGAANSPSGSGINLNSGTLSEAAGTMRPVVPGTTYAYSFRARLSTAATDGTIEFVWRATNGNGTTTDTVIDTLALNSSTYQWTIGQFTIPAGTFAAGAHSGCFVFKRTNSTAGVIYICDTEARPASSGQRIEWGSVGDYNLADGAITFPKLDELTRPHRTEANLWPVARTTNGTPTEWYKLTGSASIITMTVAATGIRFTGATAGTLTGTWCAIEAGATYRCHFQVRKSAATVASQVTVSVEYMLQNGSTTVAPLQVVKGADHTTSYTTYDVDYVMPATATAARIVLTATGAKGAGDWYIVNNRMRRLLQLGDLADGVIPSYENYFAWTDLSEDIALTAQSNVTLAADYRLWPNMRLAVIHGTATIRNATSGGTRNLFRIPNGGRPYLYPLSLACYFTPSTSVNVTQPALKIDTDGWVTITTDANTGLPKGTLDFSGVWYYATASGGATLDASTPTAAAKTIDAPVAIEKIEILNDEKGRDDDTGDTI